MCGIAGFASTSPLLDGVRLQTMPYAAKIDAQGRQKAILRRILRKYIPDHLIDRPKMGFSVPWVQWCRGPLGNQLRARWHGQTNTYHRPEAATRIFPAHKIGWTSRQWNAYCALQFFGELSSASQEGIAA
jgi:asparagine synthetase B (glutamine-hydrolysing)